MEQLPDELLVRILDFSKGEGYRTLLATCLTNRRFQRIAHDLLLQRVRFTVCLQPGDCAQTPLAYFNRVCKDNPNLIRKVEAVSLRAETGNFFEDFAAYRHSSIYNAMLELYHNLRQNSSLLELAVDFDLRTGTPFDPACPLLPFQPTPDSFQSLKVLGVYNEPFMTDEYGSEMSGEILFEFLKLPELVSLHIDSDVLEITRKPSYSYSQSLQALTIGGRMHVTTLDLFLQSCCMNLTKLSVDVELAEKKTSNLEAERLLALMPPHLKSLQFLLGDVISPDPIDFSVLPQLAILAIDATLLFGRASTASRSDQTYEICRRLPRSLQELTVIFHEQKQGVFIEPAEISNYLVSDNGSIWPGWPAADSPIVFQELQWVQLLVEQKHTNGLVPDLQSITLEEIVHDKYQLYLWDFEDWTSVESTAAMKSCRERDVEFNINLRIPQDAMLG